jgi:ATP-dependent Clp protease ATP-binding subunit ClpA
VVGREEEIARATQILTRRTKNNVILLGPPGVGKTAIVEGLALRIVTGDVPTVLQNKRVLSLQVAEILAGTKYRGEFEERIKRLITELRTANRGVILFVDEIHTIMQARGTEGSVNLSDILKPALARGDLQLLGATTQKEYEQFIQPEESWDRRFQPVIVDEPSVAEAITIVQGIKRNYETYHQVTFSDEAIEAAVRLSHEYIKGRRLPDKAIDLIDEAGAMVNIEKGGAPDHAVALMHGAAQKVIKGKPSTAALDLLTSELQQLRQKEAVATDVKELQVLRKKMVEDVKKIEAEERVMAYSAGWPVVNADHIREIVADWVGMPAAEIH